MSYRRKQAPPKPEQQALFPPTEVSYSNPGAIRTLSTSQVVSSQGNPLICSCFLDYSLFAFTQNFLPGR